MKGKKIKPVKLGQSGRWVISPEAQKLLDEMEAKNGKSNRNGR